MANDGLRDLEQQAWAGFLLTHDRLWRELEAGLAPMNMSMAEYNVLTLLEAAGEDGMRMSDLARERLMSTGGVTRLADRLQQRGLIRRRQSSVDARSFDMVLTRDGQAALDRARARHHQDLRRLVFDRLDDDQLRCLATVWQQLVPPEGAGPSDQRTC
ncbi:MAG TPA: MarR family transcriptional regulator [Beutenbergiaceae bacterium]|nr:MarR family transcriptional regulator [Beutenbergiaceae bacterium]